MQRTFKPGQTVTVNVKTQDAKAYEVYGTIYKKTGDTWTSVDTVKAETKIKDTAVDDSTFRTLSYDVPDSITEDSSYRVDITVKDGTTTLPAVPYYFLVVTE